MGKKTLSFREGAKLLEEHDIPVADHRIGTSWEEIKKGAEEIGFPVTIKIDSPDIIHKSDEGCVKTDLQGKEELKKAFEKIKEKASGSEVNGYVVQEQCQGTEMIIGGDTDPQFGEIVLFGIGGIFVEVLEDVSIRITPVNEKIAGKMIEEIQAYPLLKGVRGREPVDTESIKKAIINLSRLHETKEEIKEIDLNPVFGMEDGIKVADIRMLKK